MTRHREEHQQAATMANGWTALLTRLADGTWEAVVIRGAGEERVTLEERYRSVSTALLAAQRFGEGRQ